MRVVRQFRFLVLLFAVLAATVVAAVAQDQPARSTPARPELAATYSYLRSNAPPGSCACFNLNGGSGTFAWPLGGHGFALAGDVTVAHAGGISAGGYGLTLSSYTAGVRYTPPLGHSPLQLYGQALAGLAHGSGSLVQAEDAGAAFALNAGGGVTLQASRRFSVRLAEADYLLTTFDNGSNNHQNNLRISSGLVLRF